MEKFTHEDKYALREKKTNYSTSYTYLDSCNIFIRMKHVFLKHVFLKHVLLKHVFLKHVFLKHVFLKHVLLVNCLTIDFITRNGYERVHKY